MVSGTLVDTLLSPSLALKDLFAKAATDGKLDSFPVIVREYFSSLFAGDALDQIPLLDLVHLPNTHAPMSLVRFRAMVQDTSCSPEMYLASLNGLSCGGWGLENEEELPDQLDLHSDFNVLKERDVIWAVNIPGEGHWCDPSRSTPGSVVCDVGSSAANSSHCKPHKFPIPDAMHVAAQLKVYDNSAELLKPTSVHEFVGMLTSESMYSEFVTDAMVPTLHVLFHHQLPQTTTSFLSIESDGFQTLNVRDALIAWISSEALGGDYDAAEWVLLSCLSSVESRNPPIFPMSITLSEFPKRSAGIIPGLSLILSEVLPLYFLLPLTLDLLNGRNFLPESKDEDLHAGILQVPNDTTIVITETGIVEGSLLEKGLENAQALQEVAKLQTLRYKFPFSQYTFPTDIKFISLTDGKKSLFLESSVIIRLRPDPLSNLYKERNSIKWPLPEVLSSFREFVIRAKTAKVTVGEQLSEYIKNDFVQERQEKGTITADDLVRRMTIARLLTMSQLETQMSMNTWNTAKALDNRRKSRINIL